MRQEHGPQHLRGNEAAPEVRTTSTFSLAPDNRQLTLTWVVICQNIHTDSSLLMHIGYSYYIITTTIIIIDNSHKEISSNQR